MSVDRTNTGPYLTPEEAAALLQIKASTLAKWRHQGKGPPWRDHGHIVYHIDELHAWSLARKRTETRPKRKGPSENEGGTSS